MPKSEITKWGVVQSSMQVVFRRLCEYDISAFALVIHCFSSVMTDSDTPFMNI